jgi:hypothetical protein
MKPHVIERDIRSGGIVQTRKHRIAEGQEHIIFNVMRKKMYSDKPKSIFREYCANALDEHVRLGVQATPFKVTFPNALSPTLKIRDYGRGLDAEQTMYFFGQFGASDKRDTNDLIGCFGLGNKVALCYTDSYTIVSVLNGVKRIFNSFVGQDEIGDIVQIGDDTPTDEPNGVEIGIAIEPKDIPIFIEKGLEVIRYFPTLPAMEGLSEQPNFGDNVLITQGTGWRYYSGAYGDHAVCMMGAIAYEIDSDAMGYLTGTERQLLNSNLQLDVKIGDVDVTSSRESLEMTDRTKDAIKARLKTVHDEMVAVAERDFANAKTEFEVRKLYWTNIQNGGGFSDILRNSISGVKWNGRKIDSAVIDLEDSTGASNHKVITYTVNRYKRGEPVNHLAEQRIICTPEIEAGIYFDDTDKVIVNYKRRAKTLFAENPDLKKVWILQTDNVAAFEQKVGLKVADMKSYKVVKPSYVSVSRGGTGVDVAKRKKHQTQVFKLDFDALKENKTAASDNWTVENIDLDSATGIYLNIDRFQPEKSIVGNIKGLRNYLQYMETVGIKIDVPVYGLKPKVTDSGALQHFDEWLKEKVESISSWKDDLPLAQEYNYYNFNLGAKKSEVSGTPHEYVELRERINKLHDTGHVGEWQWLLGKLKIGVPPASTRLKELKEKLFVEYPLLEHIQTHAHSKPAVLAYLNSDPQTASVNILTLAKAA